MRAGDRLITHKRDAITTFLPYEMGKRVRLAAKIQGKTISQFAEELIGATLNRMGVDDDLAEDMERELKEALDRLKNGF